MQNGVVVEPTFADATIAASAPGLQSGRVDGLVVLAPQAADMSRVLPKRSHASPSWVVAPSTGSRCSELAYVANALVYPANVLILLVSMLLVATHWSFGALAIALGVEALYLLMVPMCDFFRRGVHAELDGRDREAKLRAREALVVQMGEGHRNELERLETLLDAALAAAQLRQGGSTLSACDATGMARLTLSYIRLAVDHRACVQALAMTDAPALDATIGSLEVASVTQPSHARPRIRRWLEIARRRADRWREAHATMETLSHQLATIAELTHLVHQDALSVSSSELSAEVDTILDEFDHGERAAREVAAIAMVGAET